MKLAYLEAGLKDINDADKQIALHMLAKELTKDSTVKLSIIALTDADEMLNLIEAGHLSKP